MSQRLFLLTLVAALACFGRVTVHAADVGPFVFTGLDKAPRHVSIELEVGGNLITAKTDASAKGNSLPMSVVGTFAYDEVSTGEGAALRALRQYSAASAVIKIQRGGEKIELPAAQRRIALAVIDQSPVLYSLDEQLGRQQLDLVDIPLARIRIEDLLPAQPLKLGDSWTISDGLATSMLGLEALDFADVKGMLAEVKDNEARLALAGTVRGGIGGIGTEIQFKSRIAFDLASRQIVSVQHFQEEKRAIGHVGPGLDVAAKMVMKFSPATGNDVTADALNAIPAKPTPEQLQLSYTAANRSFQFSHDRRWFITDDGKDLVVLRMIDRGELVAQCSISTVAAGDSTGPMSLEGFQSEVQRTLGKHFGKFEKAAESPGVGGSRVYRIVATGTVSELPISWVYYWVGNPTGSPFTLAFTFESSLAERFGEADRAFAATIRPVPAVQAARPQKRR